MKLKLAITFESALYNSLRELVVRFKQHIIDLITVMRALVA
ncbi:hypothetical protein [Bacillus norwichensis]|nr:hypothetical protein [Bacillus norwichensis]